MKINQFQLFAVSIVTAILTTGCIVIDLNGCGMKTVKGSGNLVTEERAPVIAEQAYPIRCRQKLREAGMCSIKDTLKSNKR